MVMTNSIIERIDLGNWNIYFLVKLFLFWAGYMDLHALPNLAFLLFLILPSTSKILNFLKQLSALIVGAALFYYDTWLPPISRILSEASLVESFNSEYLIELAQRFINIDLLALIAAVWIAYLLIGHYLRIGIIILTSLFFYSLPLHDWFIGKSDLVSAQNSTFSENQTQFASQQPQNLNDYLNAFYQHEKSRRVAFKPLDKNDVPFDILYLHICSFAWDDLKYAKRENDLPVFDLLFSNFNSAASYSGPAAIRLLRSGCGQPKHADLYKHTDRQCYIFEDLKSLGFQPELALNHDGHFDDFIGLIQKQDGMEDVQPLSLKGLKAPLRSFDGTPIYSDLEVLDRWLKQRDKEDTKRTATLYNTITMHDGNRYTDDRSTINSTKNFNLRLDDFLTNLNRFFKQLEQSKRRILVIMIPEHGAAIRGDKIQISGLREIPSPAITHVPAGIRLFGPGIKPPLNPIRIDQATSHLDINSIMSKILALNPFAHPEQYKPERLAQDIQGTAFVSENAGTVVLRHKGKYYIRLDGSLEWAEYPTQ